MGGADIGAAKEDAGGHWACCEVGFQGESIVRGMGREWFVGGKMGMGRAVECSYLSNWVENSKRLTCFSVPTVP